MFRDGKNLKDASQDSLPNKDIALKDMPFPISYTKTNKLITALYMVTDIVDKEEPLRQKLRTLGTEIISDIFSAPHQACRKISELVSFLGIARALNIISAMNCDILEKEFFALDLSIKESTGESEIVKPSIDLVQFLNTGSEEYRSSARPHAPTRLGVQKGSTLLKALSGVKVSDKNLVRDSVPHQGPHLEAIKGQRRTEILNIIKANKGNATIKDIKDKITTLSDKNNPLFALGDKTLQRELVAMVAQGVLKKEGEKRWSRYSVAF